MEQPQDFNFVHKEREIEQFWDRERIFEKSLAAREGKPPFVFYEGPPTANGLPHIGHFLTRIYKDLYGRYKTMRGYYVLRRAGWDTHGLPVELEIEKQLGLSTKKDIEQYGIAKFNTKAKESVWKYKSAWEAMTKRMGFWLDLKHPYITYEPSYIESVWWILSQIWDRGLLYQGHKVLPYCTRCGTALSSHEVAQGYKEVTDTSVYVKFKLKPGQNIAGQPIPDNTYVLAWTTTPWTLPGNVALAVGEAITYVIASSKLPVVSGKEYIIIAKDRLGQVAPEYQIEQEITGKDLVGLSYEPLFDIAKLKTDTSYKIYPADFVTTADGTGVVHTAVMYGEDDYALGKQYNLPTVHTVDADGNFTSEVPLLAGRNVHEVKHDILELLRANGQLYKTEDYTHTYPFCWRCKTALIYYAKNSWFIRMSSLRSELTASNQTVNWTPAHIRDGRFGEFLKEAKDWALSRERYWGTPLPLWRCADCGDYRAVGSYEDLEKYRYSRKNSFYLLRHGRSTKNGHDEANELVASRLEHDTYVLTSEGRAGIAQLAQQFKAQTKIDLIVTSPFKRTQETARIMAEALGAQVITDDRLKELDHGSAIEGQPHALCKICHGTHNLDTRLNDGETRREVKARMMAAITELDRKYQGKKILIVSHGDPLWLLESALLNFSDDETFAQRDGIYIKQGELKKIQVKNFPYNDRGEFDPHRPYIDEIMLKCQKCPSASRAGRGKMTRVLELTDVWFDSGAMPLAQWHYPFENKKLIDAVLSSKTRQYPADFIVEAIDQTRGWFYTMLAIATALGRPAPYRNVNVLGFVTNDQGKKLSKSEGAGEKFGELLEVTSVDALRWYFYTVSDVGDDKRYSLADVQAKYRSFQMILFNVLRFLKLYSATQQASVLASVKPQTLFDRWLTARLQTLVNQVTDDLDAYRATSAARAIERFVVEDLSQWWLRLSRERFQRPESPEALAYVSQFLTSVLMTTARLAAPFMPYVSEYLYQELMKTKVAESVHLLDWPKLRKLTARDESLAKDMEAVRELVTAGLAQRKAVQLKVRQPLARVTLKREIKFPGQLAELIKQELNIKKIVYDPAQAEPLVLDTKLTPGLIQEGIARDVMRLIQDMRKEAGYKLDQKIKAVWQTDDAILKRALERYVSEIARDTLLASFDPATTSNDDSQTWDISKTSELRPAASLTLRLRS